jgi:hypothetical protein
VAREKTVIWVRLPCEESGLFMFCRFVNIISFALVVWKRNIIPGLNFCLVLLLREKAEMVILVLEMQRLLLVATRKIK